MKVLLFVGTVGAETKWRVEPCSALRREALLRRPVDVLASGFEFRPMVPWKLVECENADAGRLVIRASQDPDYATSNAAKAYWRFNGAVGRILASGGKP